jgi:hypothetical protein
VAAAEAASPGSNAIGFVAETDTFYRFVSTAASATVRDGKVILNTGSGGSTRWVGLTGRYGNIANYERNDGIFQNNSTYGSSTNTFLGRSSLGHGYFTTGYRNVAIGFEAGYDLTTASANTLVGPGSGKGIQSSYSGNTLIGQVADTTYNRYYTDMVALGAFPLYYSGSSSGTQMVVVGSHNDGEYTNPANFVKIGGVGATGEAAGTHIGAYIGQDYNMEGPNNLLFGHGLGNDLKDGEDNVVVGAITGGLIDGSRNVFLGGYANSSVEQGVSNIAFGAATLDGDTRSFAVAFGWRAGVSGGNNTVSFGYENFENAPTWPANAPNNIAFGYYALRGVNSGTSGLTGNYNIAFGSRSLQYAGRTSSENIGLGDLSGQFLYDADNNIYIGVRAGNGISADTALSYGYSYSGSNIAIGSNALQYVEDAANVKTDHFNVVCGHGAGDEIRDGYRNTFLGNSSGGLITNGNDNTCLGRGATISLPLPGTITWTYNDDSIVGGRGAVYFSSDDNGKLSFLRDHGTLWVLNISTPPDPHIVQGGTWDEILWGYRRTAVGSLATCQSEDDVRLGVAGSSTVHGGTYTTDSDERLKTNIEDCDLGLDFIKALRPRRFHMKADPQGPINHGFVAQEVGVALNGVESGIRPTPEADEAVQSVTYEEIIAPLTVAVQELAAKVVSLRARIQVLKNGETSGFETTQADA